MAQRWQYVTQAFYKRLYHINNGTQNAIHFSGVSDGEESTCNAEDLDSIPGLGRSTGEVIGYPLQYSWASLVAQLVKYPPAMQKTWV